MSAANVRAERSTSPCPTPHAAPSAAAPSVGRQAQTESAQTTGGTNNDPSGSRAAHPPGTLEPKERRAPGADSQGSSEVIAATTPQTTALMPRGAWETYLETYARGYTDGIVRGRQLADDEAASLHAEAVRIVHAMARIDPHVERERRRRECQADAARRHDENARPWAREAS